MADATTRPKWVYPFNDQKAQKTKANSGNFIFEGETHGFEATQPKGISKK
jgi:hypothetical protein